VHENELANGQSHRYTLNLAANQIARVIVEPRDIDVVLSVSAPDGSRLFDTNSRSGASGDGEQTTIATREGGPYRLEIAPFDPAAAPGRYTIRLDRFLTEREYVSAHLADLARVWGAVKFFHPFIAHKAIDWDYALIQAIPSAKTARTPGEYRAALDRLLAVLDDPATTADLPRVERRPAPAASGHPKEAHYYRLADGVVVMNAADWAAAMANNTVGARMAEMLKKTAEAGGIVIDARYEGVAPADAPPFYLSLFIQNLLPQLLQRSVPLSTERYRLHNGYTPQRGGTSGGYQSFLMTRSPEVVVGQAREQKPIAVLIDERTPGLRSLLSGLQAAGAKVVQVGAAAHDSGGSLHRMRLLDGVRVNIRTTEFISANRGSVFQPDLQLTKEAGQGERGVQAALAALKAPVGRARPPADTGADEVLQGGKDNPYMQMSFPDEEYRLLALFRYWNVINYFYPYKQLLDRPWDTVLTEFIPRFLESRSAVEYQTAVAAMVARMQDTHGNASGLQALNDQLGTFAPPVRLASAGGRLTVVELIDAGATEAAGIRLGDAILTIDDEAAEERVARLAQLRALSTTQATYSHVYPAALRGPRDTVVKLRVAGADKQTRDVSIRRSAPLETVTGMRPRTTPVYQVLANGYGYIDLARLPLSDAQKAIDALMRTPAIIFDMRGYPNGTAWEIAPRLSDRQGVTAALFRRPLQDATSFDDDDRGGSGPDFAFAQKLPPRQGSVYKGRVVMLINEFAISQAEHTCLFFESATNVTFIGTPTNGANGDVTNLVLPGGIYVSFTGHDVRHADGRQLQRVGIQPHVRVEPTQGGISSDRDEVLEAAFKHLDGATRK
jgi:C-terminal processing protease CtpA/Prc